MADDTIRVEPLMREIEDRLRDEVRRRLLAQGGAPEYQDPDVFRSVDALLRRAAERPRSQALMPEFLARHSAVERLNKRFEPHFAEIHKRCNQMDIGIHRLGTDAAWVN